MSITDDDINQPIDVVVFRNGVSAANRPIQAIE
jgi:hypothetical protein